MSKPKFHARERLPSGVTTDVAAPDRAPSEPSAGPPAGASRTGAHRGRWLLGAAGLLLVAAILARAADQRPGFDPFGWLVWGHLTLHGALNTDGAPSWKPLPYLFTLPYALAGHNALYLWMVTAYALSLSGLVFAWRVAYVLVRAPRQRRYAAQLAGLVAAVALAGIQNFPHAILSSESDAIIVALCLAAVDCALHRRYRWAFWVLWLGALGRPEAWAPLGAYAVWAAITQPRMWRQIVPGLLVVPLLWFGIPAVSSKSPFTEATLAEGSIHVLHGSKFSGVISRFLALSGTPIKLAAAVGVALAALRRDRGTLVLAAAVVLWVAVEIAFALHGWSAVPRYIYEAAAGTAVLAGVGVGRAVLELAALAGRLARPSATLAGGLAAAVLVGAFAVSLVPVARGRVVYEHTDLRGQHRRTTYLNLLARAVDAVGPARILACGQPAISLGYQSVLAFDLGTSVGSMFYVPSSQKRHKHPIVAFARRPHGWQLIPSHWTTAAQAARCRRVRYRT